MAFTIPSIDARVVAILGGGVLGRRIACAWAASGYDVVIRDPSPEQRTAASYYCKTSMSKFSSSPKRGSVNVTDDLAAAVEKAWLVIEAVPEQLPLKISTFADLERLAPTDAILCTNSSSYKSREMLGELRDDTKRRVLNMHYYMPPETVVVELMTCGFTDEAIFPFLYEKLQQIGMRPYIARKESTGFIFNRLWAAIKREILNILSEEVSTPAEIEEIWKQMFTGKSGPVEMMDKVGLDTVSFIEQHYISEFGFPDAPIKFLQKYIDEGKLGRKSAKGGLMPPSQSEPTGSAAGPRLYILDTGLSTCHPKDAMQAGRVLVGSTDAKPMQSLIGNQRLPDGVDISPAAGRMFWTLMGIPSMNDGAIFSSNLDGTDVKEIVSQGVINTPKQLTIDHQNSKLYIGDREGLRVWRCNFDGSDLQVLVQTGDWEVDSHRSDQTRWCVGVAVSPATGKFYWTQKGPSKGSKGRILRANIDFLPGEDAKTRTDVEVLFQNLPEPIDLDIDEQAGNLYWTDRGELPLGNSINRAKIESLKPVDGNGPSLPFRDYQLLARGLHEAIGIKLDSKGGRMYVTDLGGSVYSFDLDGGDKKRLYEGGAFTGIAIAY
jgi:3-hydroxyacyl-CoA dehydrogenase/DNA-binding beta-propeller fold protein YncE